MMKFEDIEPNKLKFSAILPCCGFGTRVNMPVNKSKELLVNPLTNKPFIQWHIDLCTKYELKPIFIIRPEKTDLIDYVKDKGTSVLYEPKLNEEWMFTVFNNREHFTQKNILLLPDTTFEPQEAIKTLKNELEWLELVCLTHEVDEPEKWGIVSPNHITEKQIQAVSKTAWGVLGFDLNVVDIFEHLGLLKTANISKYVKNNIPLTEFKDHTRG